MHNTGCLDFLAGLRLRDDQSNQNDGCSLFDIPDGDVVSTPSMIKRTLTCTKFCNMKQGFGLCPIII